MDLLASLAPLFLLFEAWQLVMGERYLGLKQIARGADPRALGLSEGAAFFWAMGIILYWFWMLLLLATHLGRVHGIALLIVSLAGYGFRRGAPLKWILVTLSIEGAVRIGLLFSLCGMLWWWHRH